MSEESFMKDMCRLELNIDSTITLNESIERMPCYHINGLMQNIP